MAHPVREAPATRNSTVTGSVPRSRDPEADTAKKEERGAAGTAAAGAIEGGGGDGPGGDASASSSVSGATNVSGILGVQEVDDALSHASKGKMRAEDILDRLEDLRVELLTGAISREKLLQLTHLVNVRRGQVSDPRLAEILDEIDLRAQVELAKHSQANT